MSFGGSNEARAQTEETLLIVEVWSTSRQVETANVFVYTETEESEGGEFTVGKVVEFDDAGQAIAKFPEKNLERNKDYIIRVGSVTNDNVYFSKEYITISNSRKVVMDLESKKEKIERKIEEKKETQGQIGTSSYEVMSAPGRGVTDILNPRNSDYYGRYMGDIKKDARIDSLDYTVLKRYVLGERSSLPLKWAKPAANLNNDYDNEGDPLINSLDYAKLKGTITSGGYTYLLVDRIEEDEKQR
jgi:hypothetical protein